MNPYIWAALAILVVSLIIVGFLWWEAERVQRGDGPARGEVLSPEFWLNPCDDGKRRAVRDQFASATQNPPTIPADFLSHQQSWRDALVLAMAMAAPEDDSGYWEHELAAFDKAYAELKQGLPS